MTDAEKLQELTDLITRTRESLERMDKNKTIETDYKYGFAKQAIKFMENLIEFNNLYGDPEQAEEDEFEQFCEGVMQ
jgi:hypothetical protein